MGKRITTIYHRTEIIMSKKRKKLPFLVGGQLREFNNAHKSWTFLDEIEYDIFFSTWSTTYDKFIPDVKRTVLRENITEFYPNAFISLETDILGTCSINKLKFHWQKLIEMAEASEYEYEYAVLTRPDIFIVQHKSFADFIKEIDKDYLFGLSHIRIPKPPFNIFVQDVLFVGKYNIIKRIFPVN
jgi:hypothetical protein